MSNRYDVCVLRRNDFTVDGRVERQAATLAAAGLRTTVLTLGGDRLPRHAQVDGFDLERLPIRGGGAVGTSMVAALAHVPGFGRVGRRASTLAGTALYYGEAIRRILRYRPRVVHCHDLDTLLPGVLGARRVGARVVYDSAELWTERNNGLSGLRRRADAARYGMIESWLIHRADAVITVSPGIVAELARRYAIPPPLLLRNVPRRPRAIERRSLRARVGGSGPILLHLGIVDINRGLEQVVRALPHLPECRLVLLGTARPRVLAALRALAGATGTAQRVVHLDPVPRAEIIAWAREADVGLCTFLPVCTSHVLALPNKLFEYAFAGVPIVASDFPDMGDLIRAYALGRLCDPTDPHDIAAAVERVLGGEPPRPDAAAIARFQEAFAWEREAEKLVRRYHDLLSGSAPAASASRAER